MICKIDGVEVCGITAAEAAAKLEGAPHSVVELTCRRLVQGQVACGCARVLGGMAASKCFWKLPLSCRTVAPSA